jgi:hypothetical protein
MKRGMVGLVSKEYLLLAVFLATKNYMDVTGKRNGWVDQDGIPAAWQPSLQLYLDPASVHN